MAVVGDPESRLAADEGQHPSYGSFPVAKGIDQVVEDRIDLTLACHHSFAGGGCLL